MIQLELLLFVQFLMIASFRDFIWEACTWVASIIKMTSDTKIEFELVEMKTKRIFQM